MVWMGVWLIYGGIKWRRRRDRVIIYVRERESWYLKVYFFMNLVYFNVSGISKIILF